MKARYWIPLVLLAGAGISVWQIEKSRNQPPDVPFTRAMRETIVSSIPTDGKIEPTEWAVARAERPGAVKEILIKLGQHVMKGQELARLDTSDIEAERENAQSSIAQIKTDIQVIGEGGRSADRAKLNAEIQDTQVSLDHARADYEKYQRMQTEQIATKVEVTARKQKVDELESQLKGLKNQLSSLVAPADRASAEARLKTAEANLNLANQRLAQSVVRAPLDGEVYQFDLKPGAFLNAGDPVATIGRLDQVKVTVFVDERDLGRVKVGMPARITWDALPGREWNGSVNKLAEQIVARGSRQVGEVDCVIQNPGRELVPGSNVNVQIRAESVDNALTIPKEALRNENGIEGVYSLREGTLTWRPVKLGIDNTTRIQVTEGLSDSDPVALGLISDKPLKDGMIVKPVFQ